MPLLEELETHYQQSRGPLREKAWERFKQLGLPTKSASTFRYLPLREFYESSFALPERTADVKVSSTLVFVDGEYRPDLSNLSALPKSVIALPLSEAMRSYSGFLSQRLSQEESNPFAALNGALCREGLFFYVPPKLEIAESIQCLHLITKGDSLVYSPRLHLAIGSGAKLHWISRSELPQQASCWINQYLDISIDEGASLHYTPFSTHAEKSWVFDALRATIKRKGSLKSLHVTKGGRCHFQQAYVSLLGEESSVDLQGLSLLSGGQQVHTNIVVDHQAPHTRSNQLFKGVLSDHALSSFEGKILVRQAAQKTEAYQLNNHLILGNRAQAKSRPNLEIFADDVKASHGATVAQVDEAQLFYLKTRGVAEVAAKELLIQGFCKELIDQLPLELQKEFLHESSLC